MKEFGHIEAQSSLDHEMAEMSPVEKMSDLQSQMHFDESMENVADSDFQDGELQKLLTSPLYAQRSLWETRCKGRSAERGKCTNASFTSVRETETS